jgi:ABC-type phosphate transport system auxiliary subunit
MVPAAIIAIFVLLALMAWRGMTLFSEKYLPPAMVWREADDMDMF